MSKVHLISSQLLSTGPPPSHRCPATKEKPLNYDYIWSFKGTVIFDALVSDQYSVSAAVSESELGRKKMVSEYLWQINEWSRGFHSRTFHQYHEINNLFWKIASLQLSSRHLKNLCMEQLKLYWHYNISLTHFKAACPFYICDPTVPPCPQSVSSPCKYWI